MYEVSGQQLSESLASANTEVFSAATVDLILNLATGGGNASATVNETTVSSDGQVTVPSGTDVALLTVSDSGTTTFTAPANIPVLIINSPTGSVDVTFNDPVASARAGASSAPANAGEIQRVVVGPGGGDKMVVNDNKNSYIDGGTGNDTITGGGGNDSILGGQGNDVLSGGVGSDTIVSGVGNDTVDGGVGYDIVQMTGTTSDYTVTVENGHVKMTKTADGSVSDLNNVQYVQLDNGQAVIIADNGNEAAVATLYENLLGRTGEAQGLQYWFDLLAKGATVADIARGFANSAESIALVPTVTDDAFVRGLYQASLGREGEAGGIDYWKAALQNGSTRADIAATFANVAGGNLDGTLQTEPTLVGTSNIKIIDGLI